MMHRWIAGLVAGLALLASGCAGPLTAQRPDDSGNGSLTAVKRVRSAASAAEQAPRSSGLQDVETIDTFMTAVLQNVRDYWSATLASAGLPEPTVSHLWVGPGQHVQTACPSSNGGFHVTDDDTAGYCGVDDTIYISTVFASNAWRGVYASRPEASAVPGDFAVATAIAHEYGHNLQGELGVSTDLDTWKRELQADCLAGTWANSAYYQGILDPGDIEEGIAAVDLLGDYNFESADHHGTPAQRVNAFLRGYDHGNPASCAIDQG
jgi:predicted metalloprotease